MISTKCPVCRGPLYIGEIRVWCKELDCEWGCRYKVHSLACGLADNPFAPTLEDYKAAEEKAVMMQFFGDNPHDPRSPWYKGS